MAQSSAFDSMHPAGKLPPTLTPTGHFAGKPTLPISRSVTLIGARKQARLQLISSTVSQSHALIVNADSGPYIRDLASREHVFVNGIQVREGQLADGDEIQIGRFTFRFNESPTTQPVEAIRNIPNAPAGRLEVDGADAPMPIESKSILIGRRDTCDVSLLEDTASTTHAILFEMDGRRYIRDLASRTGTFVNGRQVHQSELSPGDEIRIGQTTIRYQAEAVPARDTLPPRATPSDLGAGHEDLVPLDEAPRKMPTPQPRGAAGRPSARPAPPAPPLVAPAGTEALELVQDQPAETEEVELTPTDLEAAPIEIEQDLLTPVEAEAPSEDEVELDPLEIAPDAPLDVADDEPLPIEAPVARAGAANESADLSDLVPETDEAEQAEVELEPLDVAPDLVAEATDDKLADDLALEPQHEPLEVADLQDVEHDVEPVAEETPVVKPVQRDDDLEVDLEPLAEPAPAEAALDIDEVATVEPESAPDELEPVAAAPVPQAADEPESEQPVEEVMTSESIDELLLLTPMTTAPTPVVKSKFAPGASQLDLEPVTDVESAIPPGTLSLEPAARGPQPIVQPKPGKPIESKIKDDLFRAPAAAPPPPRPQPVAPVVAPTASPQRPVAPPIVVPPPAAKPPIAPPPATPAKVAAEIAPPLVPPPPPPAPPTRETLSADIDEIDFGAADEQSFESSIGKSPRLSELAFEEPAIPDFGAVQGTDDLNFESPDLATSLDFANLNGEGQSEAAFAPDSEFEVPTLDFGEQAPESLPGFDEPSAFGEASDVAFDLDEGPDAGKPMADTIVGAETPVFSAPAMEAAPVQPPPRTKAPIKQYKPTAPVRKPPTVQAEKPAPVIPAPVAPAPMPEPMLELPSAPIAESPEAAPVEVAPVEEAPVEQAPVEQSPGESGPSLDLSFPPAAAPVAPAEAEAKLPLESPAAEVLPPTESTPESALSLDDVADTLAEAPPESSAIGEPRTVELTDSSFGRAVESFVGDSTGPIVEEPEQQPEARVEPEEAISEVDEEVELEPTPEPEAIPSDDTPEPILPVAATPRPVEVEPAEPDDKLFDLEPLDVARDKPIEPAKSQAAELEIELEPVVPPEVEAEKPEPVELLKPIEVEPVVEPAPEPEAVEVEPAEVEAVEVEPEPVDLDALESLEPIAEAPAAASTPPVSDPVDEWGIDLEPIPEVPPAPKAQAAPPTPQPVAKAPAPPTGPPPAPAPPASAPNPNFAWGADQDHFLGGRPLPLGGAGPSAGRSRPMPSAPMPSAGSSIPTPSPNPPPPSRAAASRVDPITASTPMPSIPTPPPRNPPRPQKSKPDHVGTAFDGLALPVREADVFGNFNTGLSGGLGAMGGAGDDIFGRRSPGPTPQPSIPASEPAPAPAKRPGPRRATKSEASGDAWTPPEARQPTHPAPQPSPDEPVEIEATEVEPVDIESAEVEPDPATPPQQPPRKKRRWFGLRILLFALLLGGAGAGAYLTPIIPNKSTVTGGLTFANFDKVQRIELSKIGADQQNKLNELRTAARTRLITNNHGKPASSFLDDQVKYLRTVSQSRMDLDKGIYNITHFGSASLSDQAAMVALLQILYDANTKLVTEAADLNRTVESLARGKGEDEARLAALKQEIDRLGVIVESAPTEAERAKLEAQAAQLESEMKAAQLASARLSEELKALQEMPAPQSAAPPAEPAPPGADTVLAQLEAQMKELNERITAVQKTRSDDALTARTKLDAAIVAFNQQVETAQAAVKDNPQLLAYVTSAQKLMTSTRDLTDQLIKRQQAQYGKLSELKTTLNDKMLARRAEVWKKDPELLKLMDRKDIISRRLNVANEQGLTKEADDIKSELNLIESMIQARQTVVADDGFYADAIDQLQKVIDATQKNLEDDRKLTMQKLDEMQVAFAKDQPELANLSPEQKQLADEMEKRLSELTTARRQYSETAETANRQADEELRSLQAAASELTSKFQARKKELDAGSAVAVPAPVEAQAIPAASTESREKAIEQKKAELAAAEKVRVDAEAASLAANNKLVELKQRAEQATKAGQERDAKIRQRDREQQELDQRSNQYEMKKKLLDQQTYPLAPTQASVTFDKRTDLRPFALLGAAAVLSAVFFGTLAFGGDRDDVLASRESQFADIDALEAMTGQPASAPARASGRKTVEV